MYSAATGALCNRLHTQALRLPKPCAAAARAEADAMRRAMATRVDFMPLRERMAHPDAYRALQKERRDALFALLCGKADDASLLMTADLICAICEESTWSQNPQDVPFENEDAPQIDFQCAETAVLLAWAHMLCGADLRKAFPNIESAIKSEVRRRLLTPVLERGDFGNGHNAAVICADILLCTLLCETDEMRAMRLIRLAARKLDDLVLQPSLTTATLRERTADTAMLTDLAVLLRDATDGQVDVTDKVPTDDRLDEILYAWAGNADFVDPASGLHTPPVPGCDIYRIGLATGDEALLLLGAQLHRSTQLPAATVTGRLLMRALAEQIDEPVKRPPRPIRGAARDNTLMMARVDGMYCALHTGGGRKNAGDFALYSGDAPIFACGNLPLIGGQEQKKQPKAPCEADFGVRPECETMTVELSGAWGNVTGLRAYQRSVLVLRPEQEIRLVDNIAFDAPQTVAFRFNCLQTPHLTDRYIRVGDVRMTWEGNLQPRIVLEDEQGTVVELSLPSPIVRGMFTFTFERC